METSTPLVSIIIPTYNHAHFLTKALTSILDQTYSDWEAIVVNNYSTDNTVEIVDSFKDSRIKLINYHNNGIIAAARNEGIRNATGKYIAFLDSDDSWLPEKLKTCISYLQSGVADLVCNDEVLVENDKVLSTWHHGPDSRAPYEKLLFLGNCISTSAVTVKRQAVLDVGLFNEEREFITAEDYDLWLKLSKAGNRFKFIHEVLGNHLKHANNTSGSVNRHFEAVHNVVQHHFQNFCGGFFLPLRKRLCIAILFYGSARQAAAQDMLDLSGKYYVKSLMKNPFRAKTYAGVLLLWFRYIKKIF